MTTSLWLISGLLSIWYFLKSSKFYPENCDLKFLNIGDLAVMISLILLGPASISVVILFILIKFLGDNK